MARISKGNELYLYQLLSQGLGIGRQALIARVEDILRADDIDPYDLECADTVELLEALSSFVRITRFRRGNTYATILGNDDFDAILERAETRESASKQAKPAKGKGRPWKGKRAANKDPKPAKPRKRPRPVAEPEPNAQAEPESLPMAESLPEAESRAEVLTPESTPPASPAEQHPALENQPAAASIGEEIAAGRQQSTPSDDGPVTGEQEPTAEDVSVEDAAEAPVEDVPEALAESAPEAPVETLMATPTPQAAQTSQDERMEDVSGATGLTPPQPDDSQDRAAAPDAEAPAAPSDESTIKLTITYDPYAEAEALQDQLFEEEGIPEPIAVQPPAAKRPYAPVSEPTVTVQPSEGEAYRKPQPERQEAPQPASFPVSGLPQSFADEVLCRDSALSLLYRLLPPDVEPLAVLAEDWRVARSTGTLSGTRSKVNFPLRYLREDGTGCIEATIRRSPRSTTGKHWTLALVDGDDGTGSSHDAISLDGLPRVEEGAWSDLCDARALSSRLGPVRELAQFMEIGSWDSLLGALIAISEPERWNFPGEGVGKSSRYGILREYLAVTLSRAREQGRVAVSPDGSFAAFNTGLLTPFGQDVYACLEGQRADLPWRFAGFSALGSGTLGARLADSLPTLPEAPDYLQALSDVVVPRNRMVVIDVDTIVSSQLPRLPRSFLADELQSSDEARVALEALLNARTPTETRDRQRTLSRAIRSQPGIYRRLARALDEAVALSLRRAEASYRLAAPAFDAIARKTQLLLPLYLVDDAHVDCAANIVVGAGTTLRVCGILPLSRAYACARVVSREMPRWLDPGTVLR